MRPPLIAVLHGAPLAHVRRGGGRSAAGRGRQRLPARAHLGGAGGLLRRAATGCRCLFLCRTPWHDQQLCLHGCPAEAQPSVRARRCGVWCSTPGKDSSHGCPSMRRAGLRQISQRRDPAASFDEATVVARRSTFVSTAIRHDMTLCRPSLQCSTSGCSFCKFILASGRRC